MIDLHSHSIFSDGTNTPAELIHLAEQIDLSALSLTDHDTVDGLADFFAAAKNSSVEAVPGVELSAECNHGTLHILGYFINPTDPAFLEKLAITQEGREERNLGILKKLNKLGYILQWEEVKKFALKKVVGRPHFAAALVDRGHVKTKKNAFKKLLSKGKPAYVKRFHFSAKECFEFIRSAGGIPVLAHPATLQLSDKALFDRLKEMKDDGLGGIEVYGAENNTQRIQTLSNWANELNLLRTGGTDFHGANTPDLKLGTGFGNLQIPDEILETLREAAKQNR